MTPSRPALAAAVLSFVVLGTGAASGSVSSETLAPSGVASGSRYGDAGFLKREKALRKRGCNVVLLVALNTAGGLRDRSGGIRLRSVFTNTGQRTPASQNNTIYRQKLVWKVDVPRRKFCAAIAGAMYKQEYWDLKPSDLNAKGGTYDDPAQFIKISGYYPIVADTEIALGSLRVFYKRTGK